MNAAVRLALVQMLSEANCMGEHFFNMHKAKQPN